MQQIKTLLLSGVSRTVCSCCFFFFYIIKTYIDFWWVFKMQSISFFFFSSSCANKSVSLMLLSQFNSSFPPGLMYAWITTLSVFTLYVRKIGLRLQNHIDLPLKRCINCVFYGNRKIHAAVYNACCFCKSECDQCVYWLIRSLCVGIYLVCVCVLTVVAFLGTQCMSNVMVYMFTFCLCSNFFFVCFFLATFQCVCYGTPAGVYVYICVPVFVCVCECVSFQPSRRVISVLTTCLSLSYREHE